MTTPFARAFVSCDHDGCEAIVDLRCSPGSNSAREILFGQGRKVAKALGWQCGLKGEPRLTGAQLIVPGYKAGDPLTAEGRDLCPKHRK